jgi:hypothetical protein
MAGSAYLQYVRSGGNHSAGRFLFPERFSKSDYNKLVLLTPEYFKYHHVLDLYSELFGKENIYIYLYEDFAKHSEEFIRSFSEHFNFHVNAKDLDYTKINEGYRRGLIPLKRFVNAFHRHGPLYKYYCLHVPYLDYYSKVMFTMANNYKLFGRKLKGKEILGKNNTQFLQSFYAASNKILIERYGLERIEEYDYPL